MLSNDQIINYLESRFVTWATYLIDIRNSREEIVYDPNMFPLDAEVLSLIVQLPHEDYLRMQYYLETKIRILLQNYDVEFPEVNNNYFGQSLIDLTKALLGGKEGPVIGMIVQHPVYGIAHGEQMLDPAFYNWMGKHILDESVQIELRDLWRISKAGSYGRSTVENTYKHVLADKMNGTGNLPVQLVNGEIIDIIPGRYYIVTESNEQCQPTAIERYVLKNHYTIVSGKGLVGFLFKLQQTTAGVVLKFLCNGLDTSNFNYDYKALGLSNVN